MNVVPGQKGSQCVTSAERTPKAVSSGADAAKCVSGVQAKSLFLIYFTFDENFDVDLCVLMFANCNKQTPCGQIDFHACLANMLTQERQEAYYGVPTYMGPQVLRNFETFSAAFDAWSLAVLLPSS